MFYALAAGVVLLDQITKFLTLQFLSMRDTLPVIPNVFHLTFVMNRGIAFGLFNKHPSFLLAAITISLGVLFYCGHSMKTSPLLQRIGLSLIVGGAIGNWIDRVRFGAVVDFLDFRVWPVFNVADSAITIGVGLYLLTLLREKSRKAQS